MAIANSSPSQIRDWVIYKITSPSGRLYIGKTANLKNRIRNYKCNLGYKQNCLKNSFIKYGFESHKIEAIDSFTSDGVFAEGKEMFWIRSFMSNVSKWPNMGGMNLTNGGDGALGRVMTEKTKNKLRQVNTGRKPSERQREICSITHKGNTYRRGKKVSEDVLWKWGKAKGRKLNKEKVAIRTEKMIQARGRKIEKIINGEVVKEYRMAKDAMIDCQISKTHFHRIINSDKCFNGFILKYKQ